MSNLLRNKEWRNMLKDLMMHQGVDLKYVAEYTGSPYNGDETVFYAKVPRKRIRFIGIGMALRQPLETINQWIRDYSNGRMLYVKDVADDLIWIYLIGLNLTSENKEINYFRLFDECQEAALMTYTQLWDEINSGSLETAELEIELQKIQYDELFCGLRQFIVDHMDSFKSAYTRPRKMLGQYVDCILKGLEMGGDDRRTLNSLRGYLDDSMINYLSGSSETIQTMDRSRPVKMIRFKPVPKNRKTHICLCLALGMTKDDIDKYLEMMGYGPLREKGDEGKLIEMLSVWDKKKPLQRAFKDECLRGIPAKLFSEQKNQAAEEMLCLRRDLQAEYRSQGLVFPYG